MPRFKNHLGKVVGKLTVIEGPIWTQSGSRWIAKWRCRCEYGNIKDLFWINSKQVQKSCGQCFDSDDLRWKHGLWGTPLYRAWNGMIARCTRPNNPCYKHYGGRGIQVCERWMVLENFVADMIGAWKPGMSIDRINNDGNYEPSNCRWATQKQQLRNRRNTLKISVNGESKSIPEWSEISGVSSRTISDRIRKGWSANEAVFKKVQ